jgi:predicted porin
MNNKIKLAVAGAVLASASIDNAGITWDAGEWTVDMNGNVNAFATMTNAKDSNAIGRGLATPKGNDQDIAAIQTGLLPNWLGFTATTRQNDLDTSVTISYQPGAGGTEALTAGGNTENRQAFLTFGDKSWGSVKVGKDLGIFGSTAILNDMTLLGVGAGAAGGGATTTLGRIGTGYIYADWMGQISYTTPNMNGFSLTAGITQPWNSTATFSGTTSATSSGTNDEFALAAQASYSWTGDFAGKVWGGFYRQDVTNIGVADAETGLVTGGSSEDATAYEVGVSTSIYNINLVAYGYSGEGVGTTLLLSNGFDANGKTRDSDGGYLQATYVIPMGTKLGVSYGVSKLDGNAVDAGSLLVEENKMLTIGAYHPLTKHLNLVAEFSNVESDAQNGVSNVSDTIALGAILFF